MTEKEAMEIIMQVAYDGEFPNNSNEAFGIACKCIEKQIPKEPFQLLKHTDYFHWECPICHMSYGMATQKVKYCYNCGQAIKWE